MNERIAGAAPGAALPDSVEFVNSVAVRTDLVRTLDLDLVGPGPDGEHSEECLPGRERPSLWYLTGFLVPSDTPAEFRADDDADDDFEAEVPEDQGLAEESTEDRKAARKSFYPSSMGLSVLVRPETSSVRVTVSWGDYARSKEKDGEGREVEVWRRTPHSREVVLALDGHEAGSARPVPESRGLRLFVRERRVPTETLAGRIEPGTRAVSVFLTNGRTPAAERRDADTAYAFQAAIAVESDVPFHPRPDLSARTDQEWDDRVADLHYADTPAYATGHGIATDWAVEEGECRKVWTTWIGRAEVEATERNEVSGVELSMAALGSLGDGEAATEALSPLVSEYRRWIDERCGQPPDLEEERRETAEELLNQAGLAADRMERGIAALAGDPDALDAFRLANRAVAKALAQRGVRGEIAWRPFQLAFLLLNLPGMVDPADPNRETVDLLFFPTGGGKTEAYLGLAAFAMVLRRLRNPGDEGRAGAGVSVIMRYTLRLLTLDQMTRASSLVCALELEREANPARYGTWPFEIGLWVGKAATPNRMGRKGDNRPDSARGKTLRYRAESRHNPAPIPMESCPWCGEGFDGDSFSLEPNADRPRELRVVCLNYECDFSGGRPLPIIAVDEPLYRRLPAFLISTVDKFASLPWEGRSGVLLGGAARYGPDGFYGAADPGVGSPLERPLPPPDLIIQDELHLISGPLGTMMGLYETAIEALCTLREGKRAPRPKIVASTATVRQAGDQVQAVFARDETRVFPPPGPDRRDSFFARTAPASETPARVYLGIAASGRNAKFLFRRVVLALMAGAAHAYREAGGRSNEKNPADPYMTLLAYFNSLRELGGARRLLEEEVRNTLKKRGGRRRVGERRGLFRDRHFRDEVVELTSRESTSAVAEAYQRLGRGFHEERPVNCAIATNMISVGLDVSRLGLMVVCGQPKTHSEYIQATSRVGRDPQRPGLVLTLLNIHKPRDRSYYERFRHHHETFYRRVEAGSVTPFSARALDRGFAGALVALARHSNPALTPPLGVQSVAEARSHLEDLLSDTFQERVDSQPITDPKDRRERRSNVRGRVVDLLDSWMAVLDGYRENGVELQYQQYESRRHRTPKPLLRHILEPEDRPHHRKFRANRSLRDVEPEVYVYVREPGDTGRSA